MLFWCSPWVTRLLEDTVICNFTPFGYEQARKPQTFHWGASGSVQPDRVSVMLKKKKVLQITRIRRLWFIFSGWERCVLTLPSVFEGGRWVVCKYLQRVIDCTSTRSCYHSLTGIKKCSPVNPARNFLLIQKCQFIFKPVGPKNKMRACL